LALARRGELLVSGSADKTIQFWDQVSLKTFTEHRFPVTALALGQNFLVSAGGEPTLYFWGRS
jgi:WD40 repeat protein